MTAYAPRTLERGRVRKVRMSKTSGTGGGRGVGVTGNRVVRVPDELWNAAKNAARDNGETVSDVIRRALAAYVKKSGK